MEVKEGWRGAGKEKKKRENIIESIRKLFGNESKSENRSLQDSYRSISTHRRRPV